MKNKIDSLKKELIEVGGLMWQKDLVSARSGNISCRLDAGSFLLSGHDACLGFLNEKDFVRLDLKGNVLDGKNPSVEQKLHSAVYAQIPQAQAVIHTHTTYINAYFSAQDTLEPFTFETKLYIGTITAIPQATPSVTDLSLVIEALNKNNICVLKNHGVVAIGESLLDSFFLIQSLEEAVQMEWLRRGLSKNIAQSSSKEHNLVSAERLKLFSREQIDKIVGLVNEDPQVEKLGKELKVTLTMVVKCDDTGQFYRFNFQDGKITQVSQEEDAEFIISGSAGVWRQIFNQEIDPFVATTQKKLNLKGDFAKLSRWYAPFSRIFELWNQVPVE